MIEEGYVLYVCDTETTGLDHERNEVIEVSMSRFVFGSKEVDQKTWLIRATNPETVEDEALKVSGHKREEILGLTKKGRELYRMPSEVLPEIENWIEEDDVTVNDRVLIGQNVKFDYDMISSMWKRHDCYESFPFESGYNRKYIDTKEIALFIDVLMGKRRKYYNLGKLVDAYKVKKGKAHRADEDTRMTKDLFVKQAEPFKEAVNKAFEYIYRKD